MCSLASECECKEWRGSNLLPEHGHSSLSVVRPYVLGYVVHLLSFSLLLSYSLLNYYYYIYPH